MPQPVELPSEIEIGPVIDEGHSLASVSDKIAGIVLKRKITIGWVFGLLIAFGVLQLLMGAATWLIIKGVGIWGINIPVGWGFAIVNFVWWIGIGHAGTLISAILLLLNQSWRNAINRFAEAMTIFAVMCAGMFPVLHTGRPWLAYWLLPYPNTMWLWPQFRSPLVWDVFAVSTYLTISAVFWYVGLIPDFATLRDSSKQRWKAVIYGALSMGWRSSARHWQRYEKAALLLAGLSTPLVVSVHTVVSFDFAVAMIPGWHTTIFPPYFVAGAIYSGFAMVLTLMIPLRKFYGFEDLITMRHIDNMAKVMLATGMVVGYGYLMETFTAWYGMNPYEQDQMLRDRPWGAYAHTWWMMIICNVGTAQLFWIPAVRRNPWLIWFLSIFVNVGMWLERYVIVVVSLHHDFLPSSWSVYHGSFWDYSTYYGTIGLFVTMLFLFIRFLPVISIAEMRELVHETQEHERHGEPAATPKEAMP
jgi:Ni/Fe-hydrogenase subunit HybB-like protein